jgi:hypothetical protein
MGPITPGGAGGIIRDRFMKMKVAIGEIGLDRDSPAHVIHVRLDGPLPRMAELPASRQM